MKTTDKTVEANVQAKSGVTAGGLSINYNERTRRGILLKTKAGNLAVNRMACCLSLLLVVLVLGRQAVCQVPADLPAFEVVDLKRSDPADLSAGRSQIRLGGRIEIHNRTARFLIRLAFGIKDDMIVGAPKWIDVDRFEMVAKAQSGAGENLVRQMFQALLAERFKLAFHFDSKVMAAYALTVGKGGVKFQESAGGHGLQCDWRGLGDGLRRRECRNVTMAEFARQLTNLNVFVPGSDLPVVDETGLKGVYDLQFEVGPMPSGSDNFLAGAEAAGIESGPTIFAALEEIGLKLEHRKVRVSMLVVDHIEPPAGN